MSQNESETENLRHPKKGKGKWDYYFKILFNDFVH